MTGTFHRANNFLDEYVDTLLQAGRKTVPVTEPMRGDAHCQFCADPRLPAAHAVLIPAVPTGALSDGCYYACTDHVVALGKQMIERRAERSRGSAKEAAG